MWTLIIITAIVVALASYAMSRRARHDHDASGRGIGRENLLNQQGQFWGHGGFGGGGA